MVYESAMKFRITERSQGTRKALKTVVERLKKTKRDEQQKESAQAIAKTRIKGKV